jgi:hypothetical protein
LGFVVADRVGGGPPEGSLSAVVEVDGDGVFGDVDGELSVGVGSAEGQFLSDDGDDPAVGGSALHRDGCY